MMHLLRVERTAHCSADWFESVAAADAEDGWGWRGGWWLVAKGVAPIAPTLLGCDTL